jgi:hypothetical protein
VRWLLPALAALSFVSPVQAARLPSACGLLTKTEVQEAFGAKVANRTIRDYDGHLRTCSWTSVPLGAFTSAQAYLYVQIAPSTKAKFETQAKQSPGAVPVRGVGKAAFSTPPGNGQSLRVWDRGFALSVAAVSVTSPLALEKALTRLMLARL